MTPHSAPSLPASDETYMSIALGLSARGLGRTWPNPSVGCVIVAGHRIVGRGWTQSGGRPHAETEALRRAGSAARGASVYVTLEPCSNYGRTNPCSKALIDAGVKRVVVGCVDPDPRVNGKGLSALRDANIEVVSGILADECLLSHIGLYHRIENLRPAVTLKLAQSLDGRIALGNGKSKWLTGDLARRHAHRLRAEHDAIMVGSGTALSDDPLLDCRIDGLQKASPLRVVIDRRGRLSATSRLVGSASDLPLRIYGREIRADLDQDKLEQACDFEQPQAILKDLANRGVTRLLVEGGAKLAASLIKHDLVDRLEMFTCAKLLGGDATPGIGELGLDDLAQTAIWRQIDERALDSDRLSVFLRQRN